MWCALLWSTLLMVCAAGDQHHPTLQWVRGWGALFCVFYTQNNLILRVKAVIVIIAMGGWFIDGSVQKWPFAVKMERDG